MNAARDEAVRIGWIAPAHYNRPDDTPGEMIQLDDKWRICRCHSCSGHGLIPVYSGVDFEGPGECRHCCGSGVIFVRPSGHAFQYPGGPAAGMVSRDDYNAGVPYHSCVDGVAQESVVREPVPVAQRMVDACKEGE
jgi:hypothetical protein